MLQTLLKIGEWQSEGKSDWDRFLEYPKVAAKDKHGNSISNYTLPIIFDLDTQEVIIDKDNLEEYDAKKVSETIPLKIKGGNNKAIYTAVPAIKLEQIYKTFFGKYDSMEEDTPKFGQLIEAIEKFNTKFLTDEFRGLLVEVFELREKFLDLILTTNKKGEREIKLGAINDRFDLNASENIVFLCVKIKAKKYGINSPTLFSNIKTYKAFLEESFFGENDSKVGKNESKHKLCYASGLKVEDVQTLQIDTRYGLNKMFVTTTKNYLSYFGEKKFSNYQVGMQKQKYLDYASEYLLHHGFVVRIANVEHVIIPQFQSKSEPNLDLALEGIQTRSDLLFKRSLEKLNLITDYIEDELDSGQVFWINFLAFDTDRKGYFKVTELIKEISGFHFQKILNTFTDIDSKFENYVFIDWNNVMTEYSSQNKEMARYSLNFNTFYKIIPIKEKSRNSFILKNRALDLFKTILENRKIDAKILYEYFTELILCHYYPTRYKSYTNLHDYSQKGNKKRLDYFKWALRDSVFKYLAFFQLLKQLKLIDMENKTTSDNFKQYDQLENQFFNEMNFNQDQRAMFYLGRLLNQVEYVQIKDKKKKTVIEKVNFNGLEIGNIQRLRNDLIEKSKQYRLKYPKETNSVVFMDNKFGGSFDLNKWKNDPLSPQEALFFMLTGYSFSAKSDEIDPKNNESE